jgi:hypothetical protein
MAEKLSADDFFTGLLAALRLKGHTSISIRGDRFDQALAAVFQALQDAAPAQDLDIRFRIRLHPVHGDSSTVRDSLYQAVQRNLISLDNPEYQDIRLKLTPAEAHAVLLELPGGDKFYADLADRFLEQYPLVLV